VSSRPSRLPESPGAEAVTDSFLTSWQEWRTARLAQLREPYGILSPIALHWLDTKAQRFDRIPGNWQADASGVRVWADPTESLYVDGTVVDGERTVRRGGVVPPHGGAVQVVCRELRIDVLGFEDAVRPRQIRWAIRVRSPHAPTLRRFTDVPVHLPRPQWVSRAVFEPYRHPRRIVLETALDTVRREFTLSGRLRFTLAGRELTLEPYGGRDGVLNIPFRDVTSGATSYGAAVCSTPASPRGS
jgi:uncharacterized protein (DUF1684 family)